MPAGKFGSKFLGKERYQQYVDELTAEGTIGGKNLSNEERKDGFKKRNNRVGFESFVKNILERKESATESSKVKGLLPGAVGKGGSLIKSTNLKYDVNKISAPEDSGKNIFEDILKVVTSIRDTLIDQNKLDKNRTKSDRQSTEKAKRTKKENKLESNIFQGLAKATDKVLAPVKGMFEKIFKFISTILLGNAIVNILKWMGNDENQGKVDSIIRFFKDFWPVIVGAYLLFGTKFGKLIRMVGGWAFQIAKFAIPKLFGFVRGNPRTAAVLASAGYLGYRILTDKEVTPKEGDEEESVMDESYTIEDFKADQKRARESLKESEEGSPVRLNSGGTVPGSGPNKDTIPAMLSPGEFVMSRGAVQQYGTSTLESMNAMGGGTNRPMIRGGVTYANGGGDVSGDSKHPAKAAHGEGVGYSKEKTNRRGRKVSPKISAASVVGKDSKSNQQISAEKANAKLLSFIASGEGGYNSSNKGTSGNRIVGSTNNTKIDGKTLPQMTVGEVMNHQASGSVFAVGRYQIIPTTMKLATSAAKVSPDDMFNEKTQDKLGLALIYNGQRPTLSGYLRGDNDNVQGAMLDLAMEWASAPNPSTGRSYYGGANKSSHTVDEVRNTLISAKDQGAGKFMSAASPSYIASGITPSSNSGSGSSGSSVKQKPFDLSTMKSFDYMAVRKALGVKTDSVSKSSRPSSTEAYQKMSQRSKGNQQQMQSSGYSDVPNFSADAMISSEKILVLGISV
tara:strand:- start:1263 stop:3467 length:2205 start_codon:yes stop_codon:yes gene_type:complete